MRKHIAALCVLTAISASVQANPAKKDDVKLQIRSSTEGEIDLRKIYRYIGIYRQKYNGVYPSQSTQPAFYTELFEHYADYGFERFEDASADLTNPDTRYSTEYSNENSADNTIPYPILNTRADGSLVGTPKLRGTKDQLSQTTIYNYSYRQLAEGNRLLVANYGYNLVLWDGGDVEKIPFDEVLQFKSSRGFIDVFAGEAGVSADRCLSYQEYWTRINGFTTLPIGKYPPNGEGLAQIVPDNGGPESLVAFSRLLSYPNRHGIEREDLWREFSLSQEEFSLQEVQTHARALGLVMQLRQISLVELQRLNTPTIFVNSEDKRIVTLTALDDDRAVVIDRGLTQNVERSVLETRYSGEALVPTKALTQNATIVADDAVREVKLPSLDAEVPQQFVLRNTGATPITLQLEYPLLGVTESKLSKDVIAPGETATLDIKVKWRSILKAPHQNVLVSIQTNDPIVPRLQLAVLLTPPQGAGK